MRTEIAAALENAVYPTSKLRLVEAATRSEVPGAAELLRAHLACFEYDSTEDVLHSLSLALGEVAPESMQRVAG